MAQAFTLTRRGYVAELEKPEARLLRGLFRDVIPLLQGRADDVAPQRDDAGDPDRRGDTDPFWDLVDGLSLAESDAGRAAPSDAALARLLPAAHTDEAEAAQHRALAEDAVIRAKTEDAQRALAALQSTTVTLDEDQAVHFSRALNDVRLVLAARLGVDDPQSAAQVHAVDDWRMATDPESTMALLYNFTTWFLETLTSQMLLGLPEDGRDETVGSEAADDGGDEDA